MSECEHREVTAFPNYKEGLVTIKCALCDKILVVEEVED
jgi:hypothetical protein